MTTVVVEHPTRGSTSAVDASVVLVAHVLTSVGWFGVAALVLFLLVVAEAAADATSAVALALPAVETSMWLSVPWLRVGRHRDRARSRDAVGLATYWWVVLKEIAFDPTGGDRPARDPAGRARPRAGAGPAASWTRRSRTAWSWRWRRGVGGQAVREDAPRSAPPTVAGMTITPFRRDVAIAVGVAVVEIVGSALAGTHQDSYRGYDALAVALLAVGAASLVWPV